MLQVLAYLDFGMLSLPYKKSNLFVYLVALTRLRRLACRFVWNKYPYGWFKAASLKEFDHPFWFLGLMPQVYKYELTFSDITFLVALRLKIVENLI